VIEGTRTLVTASGERRTVRTLVPETAADVAKLKEMEAAGTLAFEPPKAKTPVPKNFDRAKLDEARARRKA